MPLQILDTESGKWFEVVGRRDLKVGDLYLDPWGQVLECYYDPPSIRRCILKPIDPPGAECEASQVAKLLAEHSADPLAGRYDRLMDALHKLAAAAPTPTETESVKGSGVEALVEAAKHLYDYSMPTDTGWTYNELLRRELTNALNDLATLKDESQ